MKLLKTIGTILFVGMLAVAFGIFIAVGMAAIALGDLFRLMGRRFTARLRGDRFRPRPDNYVPVSYDGPRIFMDADGFVEPPPSPEPGYGHVVHQSGNLASYASTAPRQAGITAAAVCIASGGLKILEFPADPAVRERLKTARVRQIVDITVGGDKVIYLSPYLHRNKR